MGSNEAHMKAAHASQQVVKKSSDLLSPLREVASRDSLVLIDESNLKDSTSEPVHMTPRVHFSRTKDNSGPLDHNDSLVNPTSVINNGGALPAESPKLVWEK